MSASFQLPKPEQLVDLVGAGAAVHLAMTGAFDDKIAELKAAQAALADAQTIADTVEGAQKFKADTDAYNAQVRVDCDAMIANAKKVVDDASSRVANVMERETAVSGREKAADSREAELTARTNAIEASQTSKAAELLAREEALKTGEQDLLAERKQLASDQVAFNQRLDSLKV